MVRDDNEIFMTRSLYVRKTTDQHLIVRSDKSVAYVTKNKRLCSTFCRLQLKLLTDTKHRAASLRQQDYLFGKRVGRHATHITRNILLQINDTDRRVALLWVRAMRIQPF